MRFPPSLRQGGTIGVTAPSCGVVEETDKVRFANAKAILASKGYKVLETANVYGDYDGSGRSASAEDRASQLCDLFRDPGVDVIVSAKGGDYQEELYPIMDWEAVEANPKWFQGYSDNTNTTFRLTVEHDIASIYGGGFGDFGMDDWHRSVTEALEFLEGRRMDQGSFPRHESFFSERITGRESFNCTEETYWLSDAPTLSGRLIGGCMDILEWMHRKRNVDIDGFLDRYSEDGLIWYMETFAMDQERITNMLDGMREDGWFDNTNGIIFGRPLFYEGPDYGDMVREVMDGSGVSVVTGADVGHKAPRMTFINGAMARFDIADGKATVHYQFI